MKYYIIIISIIIGITSNVYANKWQNFYGIAWDDTVANHLRYAKSMGYDGVAIKLSSVPSDYKNDPNAAGLKFYLIDNYLYNEVSNGYTIWIDTAEAGTYTTAKKEFYLQNMVWGSSTMGGTNTLNETNLSHLASSYFNWTPSRTRYRCQFNWQDQEVIDNAIDNTITLAQSHQTTQGDAGHPFVFGGTLFDMVKLTGEFYKWPAGSASASRDVINYWTGTGSGIAGSYGTITLTN